LAQAACALRALATAAAISASVDGETKGRGLPSAGEVVEAIAVLTGPVSYAACSKASH
jgi:hypothetical protein